MSDVPPRLSALYASDRVASGVSTTDRERIFGQVLSSVGVVAAAGTATATGTASAAASSTGAAGTAAVAGIAGKLVALILILGAIGGSTAALLRDRGDESQPRASRIGDRANSATEPPIATPVSAADVVPRPLVERGSGPVVEAASRPPVHRGSVGGELATGAAPSQVVAKPRASAPAPAAEPEAPAEPDSRRLSRAWMLYAHGDAHGSLALLDELSGSIDLAEERDALRVTVLARLGRAGDARAAATAFVARFPTSVYRATVTAALDGASP